MTDAGSPGGGAQSPPTPSVAARLLRWHAQHGRHDLPWQTEPTAYRVWVSEIMLQQTQVGTVIPYYERFMVRFPDVRALADAPMDEVLHHWSGLGYYARARNLHAAARLICAKYAGEFPNELAQVHALPGVGRSTAGAILALARDQRHPILDGNVKRVLARYHAVEGWPGAPKVERQLWELAEQHTPEQYVAIYTQAVMDLGATVCRRSTPLCEDCPLQADCLARQSGRQSELPGKRPRKSIPVRATRMLMVLHTDGSVLVERRPPAGVWGGLWSFPELGPEDDAQAWVRQHLGVEAKHAANWDVVRHTFSHFHLDITPQLMRLVGTPQVVLDDTTQVWYNTAAPKALGLAAPVQDLLERLGEL